MASQGERRAETRRRLLEAAAALIAERGVEGASIDAIAEAADRTSGAVYDHFGGKEGLLLALADGWKDHVAAVIAAEIAVATTLDERLGALWRNVAEPPDEPDGGWVRLEHELWSHASRHQPTQDRLAARYRAAWGELAGAVAEWAEAGEVDPAVSPAAIGPVVIGVLIGLEMQRRLDPAAVTEATAVAVLRSVLGAPAAGADADDSLSSRRAATPTRTPDDRMHTA